MPLICLDHLSACNFCVLFCFVVSFSFLFIVRVSLCLLLCIVCVKVCKRVEHVDVLAGEAVTQIQLAYAALSRSLQHKWKFLLRVVPWCGQLFQELKLSLFSRFYQPCLVLKCL